jgi:hypothetical protein
LLRTELLRNQKDANFVGVNPTKEDTMSKHLTHDQQYRWTRRMVIGGLIWVALATGLLGWVSSANAAPPAPATLCGGEPCQITLSEGGGTFLTKRNIPDGVSVSINVYTREGRIPLTAANGCKAVFSGNGAVVRASICEPGYSRLQLRYTSKNSPVQILYQIDG